MSRIEIATPANIAEAVSTMNGYSVVTYAFSDDDGASVWGVHSEVHSPESYIIRLGGNSWNKPNHWHGSIPSAVSNKGECITPGTSPCFNIAKEATSKRLASALIKHFAEWTPHFVELAERLENSNSYNTSRDANLALLLEVKGTSTCTHSEKVYFNNGAGIYATIDISRDSVRMDLSSVSPEKARIILELLNEV